MERASRRPYGSRIPSRTPDMPWSRQFYPPAMENLSPIVPENAIEVANALLEEGHVEGGCMRVGIARAHEWAARRDLE